MKQGKQISRRAFLKGLGGSYLMGGAMLTGGCGYETSGGKGWVPQQYRAAGQWKTPVRGRIPLADDDPALVRDDRKCILCGQCLQACKEVQSVFGHYGLPVKREVICVHCGQCALWCPTAAITERDDIARVEAALADPSVKVVVQTAPATRVALGEEFNLPPGHLLAGQQIAAWRQLGAASVFDTCFAADLTIMEEAAEFLERLKHNHLPHFTSCCPAWVKFCEYFYPEQIGHLSTAKSPQQMLGALVKSDYIRKQGLQPESVFSVAVMPCTAKKFECQRPGMDVSAQKAGQTAGRDVDVVLTVREAARLFKRHSLDVTALPEENYDALLGRASGAGMIFGATGGVTEATMRTAWYLSTGEEPPAKLLSWSAVRGLTGVREAEVAIPGVGNVRVAVCHGLRQVRSVMNKICHGDSPWQFIEVMACPGGCSGGGGQPRSSLPPSNEMRLARIQALYALDQGKLRSSFENADVQQLYATYLGQPLGEKAEQLLHTSFVDRSGAVVRPNHPTMGGNQKCPKAY